MTSLLRDPSQHLQDYARRQRGDVKMEEPRADARVSRLFRKMGYGFLETPDGRLLKDKPKLAKDA